MGQPQSPCMIDELTEDHRQREKGIQLYTQYGVQNTVCRCQTFAQGANMRWTNRYIAFDLCGYGLFEEGGLQVSSTLIFM